MFLTVCLFGVTEDFWVDLARTTPYTQWAGGFVYGFFFEKGIYNMENMQAFLKDKFGKREVQKNLNIAVTDILSGKCQLNRIFQSSVLA